MTEIEYTNPLFEASVKLCAAIKKHKCLYGKESYHKYASPECEAAWRVVSAECKETLEFCKKRWKTLRKCFFEGLKRRGNKYYLHEHLTFLQDEIKKKDKSITYESLNDDTNSSVGESLPKHQGVSRVGGREVETINIFDDDDVKSVSSQTTSADESHETKEKNGEAGVFIIDEFEDIPYENDKDFADEKRLSYKRSCKRPLDPELIDELTEEETGVKRSRKNINENFKSLANGSDKSGLTSELTIKLYKVKDDKLNIARNKMDSNRQKMVDHSTNTDLQLTRDFATQYELKSQEYDDIFIKSIRDQLEEMNPRQKMNFKRKIYQSLLEVFDDVADFPKFNGATKSPNKQADRIVNSTVGELRLMRELVSLVQAAKNTPEIIEANEKVNTFVRTKPPLKIPLPIVEKDANARMSPLSLSLSPDEDDDDDLQMSIDNDDDVPLPRSIGEIRVKSTEPSSPATEDSVKVLPRHVLQKVVKVAGSGTSTIVTRDGDKRRIYRIYPKMINAISNENRTVVTKNSSNVGTFYVPSLKHPQVTGASTTKSNGAVSSINIRAVNTNPTNNANEITNPVNKVYKPTTLNTANSTTNSQSIFKNVHPANRILCSSTGTFKTVNPTYIQKTAITMSAGAGTTAPKIYTTKVPISPMLPPNSNITVKRTEPAILGAPLMQRRYSVCCPPPSEKANSSLSNTPAATASKKQNSFVSQIKISQPISLNTAATNVPTSSSSQTTSSNNTKSSQSSEADIKIPMKSVETSKENVSKRTENIPTLETAGTVEADILDPLFVKPPQIKLEPVDD